LRKTAAEVVSIAESVDSPGAEIAEPCERLLALLAQSYTMERERTVHAPGTATAAAAPVEADLAEMLF
jgi:hypothetical protein